MYLLTITSAPKMLLSCFCWIKWINFTWVKKKLIGIQASDDFLANLSFADLISDSSGVKQVSFINQQLWSSRFFPSALSMYVALY